MFIVSKTSTIPVILLKSYHFSCYLAEIIPLKEGKERDCHLSDSSVALCTAISLLDLHETLPTSKAVKVSILCRSEQLVFFFFPILPFWLGRLHFSPDEETSKVGWVTLTRCLNIGVRMPSDELHCR